MSPDPLAKAIAAMLDYRPTGDYGVYMTAQALPQGRVQVHLRDRHTGVIKRFILTPEDDE